MPGAEPLLVDSRAQIEEMLGAMLEGERVAQRTLSMVPSENGLAAIARLPLLLDLYNRYFFNEGLAEDRWHFRGAPHAGALEARLILPLLREMTGARHVTLRPLSGLSAMALVLAALGGAPGSTVATVPLGLGGHYATESIARRMGLEVVHLPLLDEHTLDLPGVTRLLAAARPRLVYVDQSNCLFPIDVEALVGAVREAREETLVHVDSSHWLGLVLGGELPNPLALGADSFGGSTHKTFPGPQKAIVATNRDDLAERLRGAQDFLISSHHLGASLSLGIALLQFAEFGRDYSARVVAATRRFGARLDGLGITVAGADRGYSAGHQLWLDTEADGVPAKLASERLFQAGIRTNFLPGLPGFGERQVLRVGLSEAIYRGFDEAALDSLAEVFARGVGDGSEAALLAPAVAELCRRAKRPLGGTDRELTALAMRVCATALGAEEEEAADVLALSSLAPEAG